LWVRRNLNLGNWTGFIPVPSSGATGQVGLIGSIAFSVSACPPSRAAQARRTGTKQRNGNPAFSGKEKPKKPIVLLPKNFLEEGFKFLPFFRKGKKS